jgi:hypothetical protein
MSLTKKQIDDLFYDDSNIKWNHILQMETIPGKTDYRKAINQIPVGKTNSPDNFIWNGASVGPLRSLFPKWKHPIATLRHDLRCEYARNKEERKFADAQFKKDVGRTGNWYERNIGYIGVRLGAIFGIGSNY